MTVLSAHQPAFMAFPGYYERIALSDVHVVLTGVQFERGSFTNRNQILVDGKPHWLTVPLKMKGHMNGSIATMEVEPLRPWRQKHLGAIRQAYTKAPRFKENWPKIQDLYGGFAGKNLFMEVFYRDFTFWNNEYGFAVGEKAKTTVFNRAPRVKTEELIGLCQQYGCDTYLSGSLGRQYLFLEEFEDAGIEIRWHEPKYEPLSILDTWMRTEVNPFSASPPTRTMKSSVAEAHYWDTQRRAMPYTS